MNTVVCNSCKVEMTNQVGSTRFKCPNCSNSEVIRCFHCRQIAAKYLCNECGFEGP